MAEFKKISELKLQINKTVKFENVIIPESMKIGISEKRRGGSINRENTSRSSGRMIGRKSSHGTFDYMPPCIPMPPTKVVPPKYSDLTNSDTNFYRMSQDVKTSLSVLGLFKASVSRKSDIYIYYANKTKKINGVVYGVAIYIGMNVIYKNGKADFSIKTPYDISAAAHLGLLTVNLDVKIVGMRPDAQELFQLKNISKIGIESAKYFDRVVKNFKKLNDNNTAPDILPKMFISKITPKSHVNYKTGHTDYKSARAEI